MKEIVFIAVAFAVLAAAMYPASYTGFLTKDVIVSRVIDGDTIEIEGGERVRLIGVDTPEKGQFLYEESTSFLKNLIEGKAVRLERDETERDKYGRLLRYVFYNGESVNLLLIRKGYASVLIIEPDSKYAESLLEEEAKAMAEEKGIWAFPEDAFCLGIFYFHYNARGNDNSNLNDEYITFRNKCYHPLDISGWTLNDKANNTYTFSDTVIQNKTTITLHTGAGEDNKTDVYWSKSRAVWNNNGDEIFVYNNEGRLMLEYAY